MDDLSTIHEALIDRRNWVKEKQALEALARLEAREAEVAVVPTQTKEELQAAAHEYCDLMDTAKIVERIREMKAGQPRDNGEYIETEHERSPEECGVLIGQYAYRYSEDIRKERDEWKTLATKLRDAVNKLWAV